MSVKSRTYLTADFPSFVVICLQFMKNSVINKKWEFLQRKPAQKIGQHLPNNFHVKDACATGKHQHTGADR